MATSYTEALLLLLAFLGVHRDLILGRRMIFEVAGRCLG